MLSLQSEVARSIARAVQITLTPEEEARLSTNRRLNVRAYELCLKGRFYFNQYSPEGFKKARDYYELALKEDPDYAVAYAWLVDAYGGPTYWGYARPDEVIPKARENALQAVAKDSALGEAHAVVAAVLFFFDWDWPAAETEFEKALDLNPSLPDVYLKYSFYLLAMDRPEAALQMGLRGRELDPLNPVTEVILGYVLRTVGRDDEAIRRFEESLKTNAILFPALQGLWRTYHQQKKDGEAYEYARKCFDLVKPPKADGARVGEAMDRGWTESGYRGAMLRGAEELVAQSRKRYVQPTLIATLYIDAGEEEKALDWLERAYEVRDPILVHLVLPDWASLRPHPRFQALLRRMGLPLYAAE